MDDAEIKSLIDELLKEGGVKYYSGQGSLVNFTPDTNDKSLGDEDYLNYVKSVELDFRNNANDILKNLELSHLKAKHID